MRRWILLLLTLWPLLYMGVFLYFFARAWTVEDDTIFAPWMIVAHLLAFSTSVGLLIVYVRDVLRRDLTSEQQVIWAVPMGLLGPPAMLVYWWRYVRPADASSPSRPGVGNAPG